MTFASGMTFLVTGPQWTTILIILGLWIGLYLIVQFLTKRMYQEDENE
jgi:hypothetical protein